MKKNLINLKNNKKLMNWIVISGLSLIIGTSLILNVVYISKYYGPGNRTGSLTEFTEVSIDVVKGNNPNQPTNKPYISRMEYSTNLTTLGDLIKSLSRFVVTTSYLGDYLSGVKYTDGNLIIVPKNYGWIINYWNSSDKKFEATQSGMDLVILNNHDYFRLSLESFN